MEPECTGRGYKVTAYLLQQLQLISECELRVDDA
jgi:hypothetical protein